MNSQMDPADRVAMEDLRLALHAATALWWEETSPGAWELFVGHPDDPLFDDDDARAS